MTGAGPDEPEVETLRTAREEARETLDAQLAALDDIDSKALSMFRLNVALVGVLVSALSFAAASDVTAATALVNPAVGAGVASFALSATAAGLTYTASGQHVGIGPRALEAATGRTEREFLSSLLSSYAHWLRYNERTNERKALLVTLSVLGTVGGALGLGVGAVAAFTGLFLVPAAAALVVVLAAAAVAGVPAQFRRLLGDAQSDADVVSPKSAEEPMLGQRTFKGRDRRE
ncbi:hypothetical protein SAMN04487947_3302 [Halogeometricum rufum]|uniref:Uncharacterized protein n=1 Tax=Halogeometricum rufum TaxID=553469 RepID=A0A1I6II78_9EURY|nr:hypothetical protein [Halogeometricum rufum]SFR66371.1 hypothetical protein SAMN04487947_3302 [Halogeometricum rufum]